ncbi:hypothetical protein [Vibrio alfacsensis]|uniref:hypothetical protein n=1 Tax=Vibrio alfacsensis TaxID=1074311 RepID=UPI004068D8D2
MKISMTKLSLAAFSCSVALNVNAASTLFTNVNVFNGTDDEIHKNQKALLRKSMELNQ